jgi:hypothetical protein
VLGFIAGYRIGHATKDTPVIVSLDPAPMNGPAATNSPPNVDVPGPTAPPGVDMAGVIAQQNLDLASGIVASFMHDNPGVAITRHDLEAYDPTFAWDMPGVPLGGPGTVGNAVISTAIDQLPDAPRRVVLALPGNDACYYVSITEDAPKQYGVARGSVAQAICFVNETSGGVPQTRPETQWTDHWPTPTSG